MDAYDFVINDDHRSIREANEERMSGLHAATCLSSTMVDTYQDAGLWSRHVNHPTRTFYLARSVIMLHKGLTS